MKWLKYTPFKIVVVESSGWDFPRIRHERLYKCVFKFDKNTSSSQSEAASILFALDKIKDMPFYNNCTHILKVTGRYFLYKVDSVLYKAPQNKDLYLQKHRNNLEKWQHTEYYGIRKELFPAFLETVKEIGLVENRLWEFSVKKNYCFIGYFKNNIPRGGDNTLIVNL
jgi:hypothetical protein